MLIIQFEKEAQARGAIVHWAETSEEVNRIVLDIAQNNVRQEGHQVEVDGE